MPDKKGNIEQVLGEPFQALPLDELITNPALILQDMLERQGFETLEEDFEAAAEFFGQEGWETKLPSDSEWSVAAPVAPLLEQHAPQIESAPLRWDGPVKGPAKTSIDYESEASQDAVASAIARAPVFHRIVGRFDPFEMPRLITMLEGQHYSTFLQRPILTLKDTLDHSIQLCRFWAEEDASLEATKQPTEWVPPEPISDDKDERVEAARVAWKSAVSSRKQAMEQWDAFVAEMRMRYQFEKRGRQ